MIITAYTEAQATALMAEATAQARTYTKPKPKNTSPRRATSIPTTSPKGMAIDARDRLAAAIATGKPTTIDTAARVAIKLLNQATSTEPATVTKPPSATRPTPQQSDDQIHQQFWGNRTTR